MDDGGSHAPIVEAVFGGPQVELLGPCGRGLVLSGFCDARWAFQTAFSRVLSCWLKRGITCPQDTDDSIQEQLRLQCTITGLTEWQGHKAVVA